METTSELIGLYKALVPGWARDKVRLRLEARLLWLEAVPPSGETTYDEALETVQIRAVLEQDECGGWL